MNVKELAALIGAEIEGDGLIPISGANDLHDAAVDEISFLANDRYAPLLKTTKAGAVILKPSQERPSGRVYLLHTDPSLAFQKILNCFHEGLSQSTYFEGIHPTAVIHETAVVSKTAQVGPYAVIDGHARIGEGVAIGAHVSIGPHCVIHDNVRIYPHAVLREGTVVRSRSIIQPGAILGSCGFGYGTDAKGCHHKQEQWGNVVLGEEVEIGANTTIDRARFKSTYIGNGTKVDNLVQIAHNVQVGKNCLIVSQVGVAGSTKLGDRVVLAGKVGLVGHIELANDVIVAGSSNVSKSLKEKGTYLGTPAVPIEQFTRTAARLKNIGALFHRVQVLEENLVKTTEGKTK